MWQVAWAHPKFGNIVASCSYDRKVSSASLISNADLVILYVCIQVIIWKETNGTWGKLYEFCEHKSSGTEY